MGIYLTKIVFVGAQHAAPETEAYLIKHSLILSTAAKEDHPFIQ